MKIKRYLATALAASLLLLCAGCSNNGDASKTTADTTANTTANADTTTTADGSAAETTTKADGETASLTLKDGVLQVGMEIGYPPMEYLDTDGTTQIGFDVEFAKALGEKLGLSVELVDTAWDGIFASLDTERYDCVISSVSINDTRKAAYNLTEPYIANKLCLVTSKDLGVTSPDGLTGLRVAVQTETTADEYMKKAMADGLAVNADDYFVYDKIIQCFDELKMNRVDAVLVDSVVASYYIGDQAETYKVVWTNDEAEPMGICLKKGNDALTAKIETAIDEIYADGTYATLATKYFGEGNSVATR